MGGLTDRLAALDMLDEGQIVQEFYFLRGKGGPWAVHSRAPDGTWRVEKAAKLSDAIAAHLVEADPEIEDLV